MWFFNNKSTFKSLQEIAEAPVEPSTEKMIEDSKAKTDTMEEVSLTEFLKSMFAVLPINDFINHKLKK